MKIRRIITNLCLVVCLVIPVYSPQTKAARKSPQITVAAGTFDRRDTVVTFTLPAGVKGTTYSLRDEAGQVIVLQVDANRRATFILPELKAGATKTFSLEVSNKPAGKAVPGVEVAREQDRLAIKAGGKPVLSYQEQPGALPEADIKPIFKRGGYIHPVYTPSGRLVTDDFPADHYHHHGIWFAWTKTEFEGRHPDFWNMGDGTGLVEFVALKDSWSGPVHAGFKSTHRYIDSSAPKPKAAINEEWEVTVYKGTQGKTPYSIFDLVATHECASSSPLELPEYRYGGVGVRGHRQWLDKNNFIFLTSEGKGRDDGNATRGRWCHMGGKVDGQLAGIAILDHPGNFRAPQPMRLNPDQPFFCYAPSQMGQWEIAPGKPYVSRYRFIVYDGPADKAELDRLWNDYANPPQVSVK